MPRNVLVVGGTGPTGVPLVNGFLAAGDAVAIYHTGRHEAEFTGDVEHLHGDPRDADDIARTLGGRQWDVAVCTSGRLRALAETLAGKTGRLVGITGQPVYAGSVQPTPAGRIPLPVPEFAPRQRDATNYTGKVAVGEDQLFAQHGNGDFEAVIVRYPGIFGPRAPLAHEWAVVKRILDGRRFMLLPHDGMAHFQRAYIDNAAHLVHLAATRPEAAGQAFNCGDERVLSARHVAEIIANELGADLELVGVPADLCRGVYPLAEKSHMVLDMSKARALLGYRDVVDVEEATRFTARWLAEHPPAPGDVTPGATGDFDYTREDRILAAWRDALTHMHAALDDQPGTAERN
jgi:nucleoside-diphosphate-sugar epimerase